MQRPVTIQAISKRGKSRIGTSTKPALVEQDRDGKLFVVFPELNQCRWINKDNDPDFCIVSEA
jgi:hypothetical protein